MAILLLFLEGGARVTRWLWTCSRRFKAVPFGGQNGGVEKFGGGFV